MSSSRRDFLKLLGLSAAAAMPAEAAPGSSEKSGGGGIRPDFIRLDTNEGAYGPSEKVVGAMRKAASEANRFPTVRVYELLEQIAKSHNVTPDQVVLGAGSTEILRMASAAFLGGSKQLVQASPTFPALEFYARSTGAEVISDPLNRQFGHDLNAMLAHAGPNTGLVYICNPNNPTGSITPRPVLEDFISRLPASCCILIDEAYHHYAGQSGSYASFLDRPLNDPRLMVSRTFSHAYGLAGLRIGYGIASTNFVRRVRVFATADSVGTLAAVAARAALDDAVSLKEFVKRNADDRQEFVNQAISRRLNSLDSHTNFVALDTSNPTNVVIQHFRSNNILIAPVSLSWDTWIRVSLGKPEDMKAFWRVWDTLPIDKFNVRH